MAPVWRAPGMSAFRRLMERRNVDLPHPDGPMSAVTARAGIVRLTSWSACLEPYQNENWFAWMVPGCWEPGTGNGEPTLLALCCSAIPVPGSRFPAPAADVVIQTAR